MSFENPTNIRNSWGLQSNFANGPIAVNKLVPPTYSRIRTLFLQTWREQSVDNSLDWGKQNFVFTLPESLQVISTAYLKIDLPVNNAGDYKPYPGLYVIDNLRLMSSGQEVYSCDYGLFLSDYCQSLSEEELRHFADIYLGGSAASGDARTVLLPLLLPNSAYLNRNGHDTRGHGVMPCYTANNRIEIQLSFRAAEHAAAVAANPPGSISGACAMMFHEVVMTDANLKQYADQRAAYSIVTRRFTELTSGWTHYAVANAVHRIHYAQPQGTVTELQFIAVTDDADESRHSLTARIRPTSIKVIADSVVQRSLDSQYKIKVEDWTNGFKPPVDFPSPGRVCFASHCSDDNTHMYTGGYNMSQASNITLEVTFDVAVRFKIIAVQLQRIRMDASGKLSSYLDS